MMNYDKLCLGTFLSSLTLSNRLGALLFHKFQPRLNVQFGHCGDWSFGTKQLLKSQEASIHLKRRASLYFRGLIQTSVIIAWRQEW